MRSNSNEDLYLVNVGSFLKGGKTTVAAPPGKAISCPLNVDNKNWLPSGYALRSRDFFIVPLTPHSYPDPLPHPYLTLTIHPTTNTHTHSPRVCPHPHR